MTEENNESNWFQDNLRIIISVGIVILLVFAIYSYSKRNSRTDVVIDDSQIEEVAMTADSENTQDINEILDEIKDEDQTQAEEIISEQPQQPTKEEQAAQVALEQKIAKQQAEEAQIAEDEKNQAEEEIKQAEEAQKTAEETTQKIQEKQLARDAMREVIESHSTQTMQKDGVIIVVAIQGDSATTLARKAAADYVTTNNIGGLTPAHKIYIEDYMRKATNVSSIHPGSEVAFSNDLINAAIESSRTLTDAQLQNLDRYAQNVSAF